ncbi:DUF3445 domain-containing protein [Acidimicrobiia bacterium EGI L10123]|uniref:heme-dependent oxidative N-demethylase family protein n=1 Tax=Salinilacustrithrix flava TaxID=2957203 RepID=UPI003D7C1D79|nr:DUF3445 domain-containing protein [Acidimicrobiia bacterium EGI L10123]
MSSPLAPGWLDELDLHVGPPDASMGTRALDPDRWFLVDDQWDAQRAEAARLLASERDEVLVSADDPAVGAVVAELDDVVRTWLGRSRGSVPPVVTDQRDPPRGLADTRLLVADDLCLLLPGEGGWRLAAGCVCFPSYWRPRDRIGGPLDGVHAVVPGYPGALAGRVDGFLGRLRPGQGVWRRNWLVHDVADLHLPTWVDDVDRPTPVPEGRWLRSERQTLVRLPTVEAVVFTIRTQQVPMAVLGSRPDVARGLAAAIRGWSPEQRAYKGAAIDDALLRWLSAQAG